MNLARSHRCWTCGIAWVAPVEFSDLTQALSGEKTTYCPSCGKRSHESSPAFESTEISRKFESENRLLRSAEQTVLVLFSESRYFKLSDQVWRTFEDIERILSDVSRG